MISRRIFLIILFLLFSLTTACASPGDEAPESTPAAESQPGMGMGRMGGSSMMARHQAPIPEEYAGLSNPVAADDESIARGAEQYAIYCATCHGETGMGDGPGANGLDPAPAPIAHTSRMMGDDYLFWRISEGGTMEPFNSVMPPWKGSLDEEQRWDVINYIRALGDGTMPRGGMMGGMPDRPMGGPMGGSAADNHEEMVQNGLDQGLITTEEGATFLRVHAEMDRLTAEGFARGRQGGMNEMQSALLETLVADGIITTEEAELFNKVHETLANAGLME